MIMPTIAEEDDPRHLEAESGKWGRHLQVEGAARWNAWLDHPIIAENYRRRARVDGLCWQEWVRCQLGRPAPCSFDLGCGAGDESFAVHAADASARLEGIDISGERVAQAEKRRITAGIPGKFAVGDANRLEMPAGHYDLVFSNHSFHHFLELERIMEQVRRALTPDGFFVLEEYVGPTQFQWTDEQMSLVRTRLSMIPERLRTLAANGQVKLAENRPTVEQVVAESPFESIRSAEIVPLFRKHFDIVALKPLGGTLQHLLYNGIVHHFVPDDEEAMRHLDGIMALENELTDNGLLPSDFMLLVGRRKASASVARAARPAKALSFKPEAVGKRHWQIGICGTFDIANYGDLLFPIIAEAELKERLGHDVTLHRFSYGARVEPHWPYEVTSVAELPRMIHRLDGLLIGGGFLIRFDKDVAPGYLPPGKGIHHPTGYWLTPALLALQHDVPLVWNAPGMHCNEFPAWATPLLREAFANSRYVSARDEPTAEALAPFCSEPVAVVPDTAFSIARLFNFAGEPSAAYSQLRDAAGLGEPYIIVQASLGMEGFVHFVQQNAVQLRGYRFLALPMGPALGDRAEIIDSALPGLVRLPEWPKPRIIAELIARSEAVVGHSYHLIVTALASGVPVFTSQNLSVGKYSALRDFQTIHGLPSGGERDAAWFLAHVGRAATSASARAMLDPMKEHWDRIAAALSAAERPKTSFAMNRFWQLLPAVLENADERRATTAASPSGQAEAVAHLESALRILSPGGGGGKAPGEQRPIMNLDRIRRHRLETDPFHWAAIPDLYAPADAAKLAETYPCDHFKLLSARGGEKDYEYEARCLIGMGARDAMHPEELSASWRALAHDLLSPEYRAAMSQLTGLDLSKSPMEVNVFHYGPGCSLGAHCDLPDKLVTHVLYFNRAWNGQDGGCLNILRSNSLEDQAAFVLPLVGNSAVIVRSDHSWHAVPRVAQGSSQSRRSVTVTFYQPGSQSSMWPPGDTTPLHRYPAGDLGVPVDG